MRRLSPRRLFLYLACGLSGILLFINIEQRVLRTTSSTPSPPEKHLQEENLSRRLAEDTIVGQLVEEPKEVGDGGRKKENVDLHSDKSKSLGEEDIAEVDKEALLPESDSGAHRLPLALDRRKPLDPQDVHTPTNEEKPWYMVDGQLRPQKGGADDSIPLVWPEESPSEDRIPDQLMYVPESVPENQQDAETPLKKILLWNGASSWGGLKLGRGAFLKEKCPVSACALTSSRSEADEADLILFKDHFSPPALTRSSRQIWMLYLLECPLHTQIFRQKNIFNWTATYRTDSTIVAPYERWQYFNENVKTREQSIDYAANKTKQVAWFVSNCGARNGRLQYARELAKYINVDIYGACGTKRCPRTEQGKCFNMLNTEYKFYLAFENSNCKDYITEKFFVNGLGHDILPIAMGARYEDYQRAAPYKSFIHVDEFAGPKELAEYLHQLDKDDSKYNEYFQWKGTGEFVNTKFFCRVCAMLHDAERRPEEYRSIYDVNDWWRGEGTCINGSWRTPEQKDKEEEGAKKKDKGEVAGKEEEIVKHKDSAGKEDKGKAV